jgi:cell division protein FtsB
VSDQRVKRLVFYLAVVAAAYFAVQGGEYSTTALFKQRTRERMLRATIDSMQRQVDSLRALKRRLASDPALQERIARETYGMVRSDKELVYRFNPAPKTIDSPR